MSATLDEYKGYGGSVHYSVEDRVLHGRLIGITDAITFEGGNVDELESNSKAAVDEYLRFCRDQNKAPGRKIHTSTRLKSRPKVSALKTLGL